MAPGIKPASGGTAKCLCAVDARILSLFSPTPCLPQYWASHSVRCQVGGEGGGAAP